MENKEIILGCHVQMKAPQFLEGSVKEALSYGANALMLYTGAPQNTKRRPVEDLHILQAHALMDEHHIPSSHMIVHAPYIINPANSTKAYVYDLAREFLQNEVDRVQAIGASYCVLHPGSFTDSTLETGIDTIIEQLNSIDFTDRQVTICLETMAGKGSEIGYKLEQIESILSKLQNSEHFGICLDTCHMHDAGYDVHAFDAWLDAIDHVIGLDKVHVVHLNDSKNVRGARKDRHANIGLGEIGFDTLCAIAHSTRLQSVPKILETPYINKKPPYAKEIDMLRKQQYIAGWQEQY